MAREKQSLSYSPPQYEVEKYGNVAILRFYEDVEEVNEVDENGGGAFIGYKAHRYTVVRQWDDGIESRILRDVGAWLDMAKREERDKLGASARAERDRLLSSADFTRLDDVPLSDAQKQVWADYREALRHIPDQPGFPYSIEWPVKPS